MSPPVQTTTTTIETKVSTIEAPTKTNAASSSSSPIKLPLSVETPPEWTTTASSSSSLQATSTKDTPAISTESLPIRASYRLSSCTLLHVTHGSVVDFGGDCLVNAANETCLGGGGVDGAVSSAGGPNLARDRLKLAVVSGIRCPTGQAVRTGPNRYGSLCTPYVVHAVGPVYPLYDPPPHDLLASAYQCSLQILPADVEHVAFSLLSAGIYRGSCPLAKVLWVGIQALAGVAATNSTVRHVYMCGFTGKEVKVLLRVCDAVLGARVQVATTSQPTKHPIPIHTPASDSDNTEKSTVDEDVVADDEDIMNISQQVEDNDEEPEDMQESQVAAPQDEKDGDVPEHEKDEDKNSNKKKRPMDDGACDSPAPDELASSNDPNDTMNISQQVDDEPEDMQESQLVVVVNEQDGGMKESQAGMPEEEEEDMEESQPVAALQDPADNDMQESQPADHDNERPFDEPRVKKKSTSMDRWLQTASKPQQQ